jgi:hypothetical protein
MNLRQSVRERQGKLSYLVKKKVAYLATWLPGYLEHYFLYEFQNKKQIYIPTRT